jgi:hypothetical protein
LLQICPSTATDLCALMNSAQSSIHHQADDDHMQHHYYGGPLARVHLRRLASANAFISFGGRSTAILLQVLNAIHRLPLRGRQPRESFHRCFMAERVFLITMIVRRSIPGVLAAVARKVCHGLPLTSGERAIIGRRNGHASSRVLHPRSAPRCSIASSRTRSSKRRRMSVIHVSSAS